MPFLKVGCSGDGADAVLPTAHAEETTSTIQEGASEEAAQEEAASEEAASEEAAQEEAASEEAASEETPQESEEVAIPDVTEEVRR